MEVGQRTGRNKGRKGGGRGKGRKNRKKERRVRENGGRSERGKKKVPRSEKKK